MRRQSFLLIASFPDSLIQFRGPLIDALLEAGKDVHVAVPGLAPESVIALALAKKGVRVHDVPLQRTGLNPVRDIRLLLSLVALILRLRPQFVLSYTIKPVVYGSIAAWWSEVSFCPGYWAWLCLYRYGLWQARFATAFDSAPLPVRIKAYASCVLSEPG